MPRGSAVTPPRRSTRQSRRTRSTQRRIPIEVDVSSPIKKRKSGTRIFPGTCYTGGPLPPPPKEAPPTVQNLVAFLVVGPSKSGKTSLIQSWVNRNEPEKKRCSSKDSDDWTMEYCKKDISYRNDKKDLRSVRVQLWDCHGLDLNRKAPPDWKRVMTHQTNTILLVVNAAHWDSVEEIVREWKKWLEDQIQEDASLPPVELLLTQADGAMGRKFTPALWIRLCASLEKICQEFSIHAWHMTTASYEETIMEGVLTVDELFSTLVESSVQRKKELNDESLETNLSVLSSPGKRKRAAPTSDTTIVVQAESVIPVSPDDRPSR